MDEPVKACCAPDRVVEPTEVSPRIAGRTTHASFAGRGRDSHAIAQCVIPAGTFRMGDSTGDRNPGDGETPVHEVTLPEFAIDATSVTNNQFAAFIADTGYRTEAEVFGFSAVFHLAIQTDAANIMNPAAGTPWWFGVLGADWTSPGGPGSSVSELGEHPAVHISWNDAVAYCEWAGRRLPTEAEWERASRGGLDGARYPWGNELMDADGAWQCNIWQGTFPTVNTEEDGWLTTAPVESFTPNAFGLWQSVGNVWEWCSDWYSPHYYEGSPDTNPLGADAGQARVLRGGSYLCHDSYCNRYRNSARSSNTPDSSMGNAGFRTVALAE
jgi:formylglycine-generating enzyme